MYWVTHGVDPTLHLLTYIAITWIVIIMRIETDIKLDYNDVLLRPNEVQWAVEKTLTYSKHTNLGTVKENGLVFIMAANMQGVGTFKMAEELARVPMFTCLDKTINLQTFGVG